MGSIFGKGGLTRSGVQQPSGDTQYYDSPADATVAASKQLPSANAMLGDALNPNTTAPALPKLTHPSFAEAQDNPSALSKGGKLVSLLMDGLIGAAAGEAAARTGDPRNGYAGPGAAFMAGVSAPLQLAGTRAALRRQQQEEARRQQELTALPAQQATQLEDVQSQIALRNAETRHYLRLAGRREVDPQMSLADQYAAAVQRGDEAETQRLADAITSLQKQSTRAESVHTVNTAEGVKQYDAATKTWKVIGGSPKSNLNLLTQSDAKDIADAIENGDQPPTLQGLYRNAAPVRAELARRGVPLAKMETDWKATQRFMASLNSTQQVRLQQAITTATDSLDKIQSLYDEWQKLAPQTGFKAINHATLIAMKNLPGRPGAVAQALDAQIADITAELGNVYMGGNSPTDQSLKLAHENFSSDWNKPTFEEGLKQARLNLVIRKNSIFHSQPAGVSPNSPYMPNQAPQGPAPAPNASTGGDPFAQFGGAKLQ